MARRRTRQEIERDIECIRKLTKRYSGDILSFKDLANKLAISEKQLEYTFKCMDREESDSIKKKIRFLSETAKKLKNYTTLQFSTSTMLGINKKCTKGIFVNPTSLNYVLEEGLLNPRRDDILYIVEHYGGKIFFKKFLVLNVKVSRRCLKVSTIILFKDRFPEDKGISEIFSSNSMFDGTDCYVMSRI